MLQYKRGHLEPAMVGGKLWQSTVAEGCKSFSHPNFPTRPRQKEKRGQKDSDIGHACPPSDHISQLSRLYEKEDQCFLPWHGCLAWRANHPSRCCTAPAKCTQPAVRRKRRIHEGPAAADRSLKRTGRCVRSRWLLRHPKKPGTRRMASGNHQPIVVMVGGAGATPFS